MTVRPAGTTTRQWRRCRTRWCWSRSRRACPTCSCTAATTRCRRTHTPTRTPTARRPSPSETRPGGRAWSRVKWSEVKWSEHTRRIVPQPTWYRRIVSLPARWLPVRPSVWAPGLRRPSATSGAQDRSWTRWYLLDSSIRSTLYRRIKLHFSVTRQ